MNKLVFSRNKQFETFLKLFLLMSLLSNCYKPRIVPPETTKIPQNLEAHGHVRVDPYYWLKERENPEVLNHLKRENLYTKKVMAPTEALQETLFQEMRSRLPKEESTVPYQVGDFLYWTRYEQDKEYPFHCRQRLSPGSPEEVILDINALAQGHDFYSLSFGPHSISPDQKWIAYAVDTEGRKFYTIYFKELKTGKILQEKISQVTGNFVWANDSRTLFYAKQHPTTLRYEKIYRRTLGNPQEALVYFEEDETFYCFVGKTKTQEFLLIRSSSTLSDEYRFLQADQLDAPWQIFQPRQPKLEYSIDHGGDRFYIRTNHKASNFRLMESPVEQTSLEHWKPVMADRPQAFLEDFEVFDTHVVLAERIGGLERLSLFDRRTQKIESIDLGGGVYSVSLGENPQYKTKWLRYRYESMAIPESIFDFHLENGSKKLKKRREIENYDPSFYHTKRIFAPAPDGTLIPISLVSHKEFQKNGKNPLLLFGYGAYGTTIPAYFNPMRLSLLERGFVLAIAHVRGSSYFGRPWYEAGKLFQKKNTFTDFIACSEHLIKENYTSNEHLYAWGGSAGGLLIGAVANMRPDLYRALVVGVPFVDIVTTMLDDSIPLTTFEYDEWGNPNQKEFYDYMLSYSPYDQIRAQAYPHLFVIAGWSDSQVQYWEPAKWVAKLRSMKIGDNFVLLRTNLEAGHGGASGRLQNLRETALQYSFLLQFEGF